MKQPVKNWTWNRLPYVSLPLAVAILMVSGISEPRAQIPDQFTNLKVLPEDISKAELISIMRNVVGGLGVRCNHCHSGPANLQGMDFATDEKESKRTARAMMLMVNAINDKYLDKLDTSRAVLLDVKCVTCHRGQTLPRFIEDLIEEQIEQEGITSAVARFKELREEHFGGFAYNFTAMPMRRLGEKLARAGKIDDALAILEMNSEFSPESVSNWVLIAQVQFESGHSDKAIASLEKALKYEPDNEFVKGQLQKMKAETAAEEKPE